jgi:hypothetical protein
MTSFISVGNRLAAFEGYVVNCNILDIGRCIFESIYFFLPILQVHQMHIIFTNVLGDVLPINLA